MASSLLCLLVFSLPIVSIAGKTSTAAISPSGTSTLYLSTILSDLGFQELAKAIPSATLSSPWSPPSTIFAPPDDSIRTCGPKCPPSRILKEHVVPGFFSHHHLSKLAFGTKLETSSPNRCLTVTSTAAAGPISNSTTAAAGSNSNPTADDAKIYVDGVEVTRPDLYNDGNIVIHGIQGFIAPLSPFSCSGIRDGGDPIASAMVDAIVQLRSRGYNVLALAMRIKWPELVGLHNMTVFALDDPSIFSGGQAYIHEVRFHVVPNRLLMHSDLAKLPEGTVLPTLVRRQNLVVTSSGNEFGLGLRINYAPIRMPDVVCNSKIVVHSLFFPFPHLYVVEAADTTRAAAAADCGVVGGPKECKMAAAPAGGTSAAAAASDDVRYLDDDRSL